VARAERELGDALALLDQEHLLLPSALFFFREDCWCQHIPQSRLCVFERTLCTATSQVSGESFRVETFPSLNTCLGG